MALYKSNPLTGELNLLAGSAAVDDKLNKDSNNPVQNKIITTKINELEKNFAKVKKSVSDGKEVLAGAITSKGIETASADSFNTMAKNVRNIKSSGGIVSKSNNTKSTFSNALYGIVTTVTSEIQEG